MPFEMTTREAQAGSARGTVYTFQNEALGVRTEVWPFLGFNCLKWQIRTEQGWGDLLYTAPDWETNPVPTRSGHPILFPFPNRLFHGTFQFRERAYQLPLNESTGTHAIHGFTPKSPWRVTGTELSDETAQITGEFQLSVDRPDVRDCWPTDFIFRVTYRFSARSMIVDAQITAPGEAPLPYGLGYHPYFCIPTKAGAPVDEMVLQCLAAELWEAIEAMPTGHVVPLPAAVDFRTPKAIGPASLDTLLTGFPHRSGPSILATLSHPAASGRLEVIGSVDPFREMLIFTPPHRKALAIEPYTCATDAANLSSRGINAGWRVLTPGHIATSTVEYRWVEG